MLDVPCTSSWILIFRKQNVYRQYLDLCDPKGCPLDEAGGVICYTARRDTLYTSHTSRQIQHLHTKPIKVKVSHNRPRWPKGFRVG